MRKNGKIKNTTERGRQKRRKDVRKLAAVYVTAVLAAAGAIGGGLFLALGGGTTQKAALAESTETESGFMEAAQEETTMEMPETESQTEPAEEYVELTEGNISDFVKVESCEIEAGSGSFVLKASAEGKPVSDDDHFYLMEMNMYDTEVDQEAGYLALAVKGEEIALSAAVNENSADSRLYSKFVVAVKLDGQYVPLCEPQYITNPEALSAYREAYPQRDSIKGILVDPMRVDQLDELHVNHAAYNIPIGNILGETTNALYPTIHYTYNGRTYAFNGQRIAEYDSIFSRLTAKGITISAILLNNKSGAYPQITHPLSRGGSAYYYGFNAAEEDGVELLAAVGAFLSQRYRDAGCGTVMNWIVGNEVNVRTDWNYMQHVDIETYAREYANAVRVFYNSIKSMNANARVYVSMDQQWDRNISTNQNYDARDLLVAINDIVSSEGNIDWGLAHHPYAYPLTNTTFWNSSGKVRKLITKEQDTSIVTMENIEVVTDFLQREDLLTADGEVRPVILSELGYSSTAGEVNQAAAFAYAYYAAESNPYIDALILSRQTDAAEEVAQGLALGLTTQGGQHKYIYQVFQNIDQAGSENYTEFAKSVIGINSWTEILAKAQ